MPDVDRAEAEARFPRANPEPHTRRHGDPAEHQRADVRPLRPKREANAELARALRDSVTGDPEDADAGEEQRQRGKRTDETHRESRQRERQAS